MRRSVIESQCRRTSMVLRLRHILRDHGYEIDARNRSIYTTELHNTSLHAVYYAPVADRHAIRTRVIPPSATVVRQYWSSDTILDLQHANVIHHPDRVLYTSKRAVRLQGG